MSNSQNQIGKKTKRIGFSPYDDESGEDFEDGNQIRSQQNL